jgi:hypothetical protein
VAPFLSSFLWVSKERIIKIKKICIIHHAPPSVKIQNKDSLCGADVLFTSAAIDI